MSTALTRAYVATSYLLGARGDALAEALPRIVTEFEAGLIRGLVSAEREVRARHLAVSVRELTSDLERRGLELGTP